MTFAEYALNNEHALKMEQVDESLSTLRTTRRDGSLNECIAICVC